MSSKNNQIHFLYIENFVKKIIRVYSCIKFTLSHIKDCRKEIKLLVIKKTNQKLNK